MADEFKITKEIMENADSYISIGMKEIIATSVARACVKATDSILRGGEEPEQYNYGLEPVYCEDTSLKARVLMGVLLAFYLKIRSDDEPLVCDPNEYDNWAGAHVINQIERFKSGEYREKAFDILTDYRETEKTVNSAIYAVLREMNDPIKRFVRVLGAMSSEDMLKAAVDTMKGASAGIQEENERQERIIKGEEVSSDGPAE